MNPIKKCSLCVDPETSDNPIFNCKSCGVYVHKCCYGIENIDADEIWKCSPCKVGISESVICELCLQSDGAFKPTCAGKWVHVVCALFTDGVIFENKDKMEPINLSNVSKNKLNKTCGYCLKAEGFCCLCSQKKCPQRIHITCAQRNNGIEEKVNEKDDSIKFRAYCSVHKRSNSNRRLSSGSVRGIMKEKGKHKKVLAQSSILNGNWISDVLSKDDVNAATTGLSKNNKSEKTPFNEGTGGTNVVTMENNMQLITIKG